MVARSTTPIAGIHAVLGLDGAAFNRGLQQAQTRWERFTGLIGRGITFGAGFGLGLKAFDSAAKFADAARDAVIGFNMAIETATVSTSVLAGSLEKGQALVDMLQRSALRPLFGFQGLTETTVQMLRFGIALNQVIPLQERIADVAAASGDRMVENQKRITWALGQTVAKGRVLQEELNQLQEAGVTTGEVLAIAGEMTNKSFREIQEIMGRGELSPRLLMAAFEEWANRRMPGLAKKITETTWGAIQIIKNQFEFLGSIIGKPLFDRFSALVKNLAKALQNPELEQWAHEMAARVELVVQAFEALGQTIGSVFSTIVEIIKTVGSTIHQLLMMISPFSRGSPSLVESFTMGFNLMESTVDEFVSHVAPQFDRLGAKIEELRKQAAGGLRRVAHRDIEKEGVEVGQVLGPSVASQYVAARKELMDFLESMEPLQRAISEQESAILLSELALRPYTRAVEEAARAVSLLSNQYNRAERSLREYQSVPLVGEKALRDRLFANDTEIARLQLRLVQMQIAGGGRIRNRAAARQLEKQISQRELRSREMQLQERVQFAPLRKALEDLGLPKELSFEEAFRNAKAAADEIGRLGPLLKAAQQHSDSVTAEYERQSETLSQQKMLLGDLQARWAVVADRAKGYQTILDTIERTVTRQAAAAAKGGGQFGADVAIPEQVIEARKKLQEFTASFIADMEEWKRRLFAFRVSLYQFQQGVTSFAENVREGLERLKKYLEPALTALKPIVEKAFKGDIGQAFVDLLKLIGENRIKIFNALLDAGKAFVGWVEPQLEPLRKETSQLFTDALDKIGEWGPQIGQKLKTAGEEFWKWIEPQLEPMQNKARELVERFSNWLGTEENLRKIEQGVEKFVAPVLSFLGKTALGFGAGLLQAITGWNMEIDKPEVSDSLGRLGGKIGAAIIKGLALAMRDALEDLLWELNATVARRFGVPEHLLPPRPSTQRGGGGFIGPPAPPPRPPASGYYPPGYWAPVPLPPPTDRGPGGGRGGTLMSVTFNPGSIQIEGGVSADALRQLQDDVMAAFEVFLQTGLSAGMATRAPLPGALPGSGR